jgi:hypothetical protein
MKLKFKKGEILTNQEKLISCWLILLTSFCFALVVSFYKHYGITWDESVQSKYGELVLDYFASGFEDKSCNNFLNLRYYGPLFESVCAGIYRITASSKFEIRHLCIAITAVLTLPAIISFSRLFKDPLVPFFASLALLMLPRYVGHSFNNSKDIPFACAFAWSMFAIARLYVRRKFSWPTVLGCGVAIGLALSMRVGGVILFLFYVAIGGFILLRDFRMLVKAKLSRVLRLWLLRTVVLVTLAWSIMVAFWPWAHQNIIAAPFQALRISTAFTSTHSLLFNGEIVRSDQLPWFYLLKYLIITTPLPFLILMILGIVASIQTQIKSIRGRDSLVFFITQLWLFFPLAYFVVKTPNVYDGIRHFLFIFPAAAVFAGVGANWVYRRLQDRINPRIIFLILTLIILSPIKDLVRLHPYQMTFFNSCVGGVGNAYTNYETDYWATSYKEAAEWINAREKPKDGRKTVVLLAANTHSRICAAYYLNDDIELVSMFETIVEQTLPSTIDYYIAMTRFGLSDNFPETPIIHTIGRENAVFTVIKGEE